MFSEHFFSIYVEAQLSIVVQALHLVCIPDKFEFTILLSQSASQVAGIISLYTVFSCLPTLPFSFLYFHLVFIWFF